MDSLQGGVLYQLVTRFNAKKCPELGLEKEVRPIYHQNQMNKGMTGAFTGYTVDDHVENGSEGLKLSFCQMQLARAAAKLVLMQWKNQLLASK
jgi:hypothetical protein